MAGGWRPLSKGDDEVSPARAFPHVSGKQGQLCKKIYDLPMTWCGITPPCITATNSGCISPKRPRMADDAAAPVTPTDEAPDTPEAAAPVSDEQFIKDLASSGTSPPPQPEPEPPAAPLGGETPADPELEP
jgi:hypothetical protein